MNPRATGAVNLPGIWGMLLGKTLDAHKLTVINGNAYAAVTRGVVAKLADDTEVMETRGIHVLIIGSHGSIALETFRFCDYFQACSKSDKRIPRIAHDGSRSWWEPKTPSDEELRGLEASICAFIDLWGQP